MLPAQPPGCLHARHENDTFNMDPVRQDVIPDRPGNTMTVSYATDPQIVLTAHFR